MKIVLNYDMNFVRNPLEKIDLKISFEFVFFKILREKQENKFDKTDMYSSFNLLLFNNF